MEHRRRKEIFCVLAILGGLLAVNLAIYWNFSQNIESNFYALPDEDSSLNSPKIVLVALEPKEWDETDLGLEIHNSLGERKEMVTLEFLEEKDGKYIYFANFSQFNPSDSQTEYRFFFSMRSWYSDSFVCNGDEYFEWA